MLRNILIILVLISVGFCSCKTQENNQLTIVFTGDVLLDRGLKPLIEKKGVTSLFNGVAPYFKSADYVVINLECPISDTISPVNKKYIFRADSKCADGLKNAGVTHCALANNHTMDQGCIGLRNTVDNLKKECIVPFGYGNNEDERIAPTIIQKDNIKVALFNACPLRIENWEKKYNQIDVCQSDYEKLIKKVKDFKSKNPDYYIVMILHWGTEFISTPSLNQRYYASGLINSGVDLIIGHHPHIIQQQCVINNKYVFYSLGNFVFDQKDPLGRKALMPIVTFKSDTILVDVKNVDIINNQPVVR
ncbi:MAG: CapA family protein [Bacteroidales bacterium]|nr:CapA family protein [Bacteroidales bacterium]